MAVEAHHLPVDRLAEALIIGGEQVLALLPEDKTAEFLLLAFVPGEGPVVAHPHQGKADIFQLRQSQQNHPIVIQKLPEIAFYVNL